MSPATYEKYLKDTRVSLAYKSKNVFIMGKYLKWSRFMSQTPWEIGGVKMVS